MNKRPDKLCQSGYNARSFRYLHQPYPKRHYAAHRKAKLHRFSRGRKRRFPDCADISRQSAIYNADNNHNRPKIIQHITLHDLIFIIFYSTAKAYILNRTLESKVQPKSAFLFLQDGFNLPANQPAGIFHYQSGAYRGKDCSFPAALYPAIKKQN